MANRLAKVVVFVSGVVLLLWQIKGTIEIFIKNRTSFSTMQEIEQNLVPPTIIFCPRISKSGNPSDFLVNVSNKDQFNEEFFWIQEKISFSLGRFPSPIKGEILEMQQLKLGKNKDDKRNPLLTIEELINPLLGLCYAFIPDQDNFKLALENFSVLTVTIKKPTMNEASVFFTSEEDRYGPLFTDMGRLMPLKVSLISHL